MEDRAQTDRHTNIHPHIKKKTLFRTRGVIKLVNPSKVEGRIFCAITILPRCETALPHFSIIEKHKRKLIMLGTNK